VFYRNPKKAFKQFAVGVDVNINRNNWQWVFYCIKLAYDK
jgi:hypothetical protein